jgi:hypothetical protein
MTMVGGPALINTFYAASLAQRNLWLFFWQVFNLPDTKNPE